MKKLFTLLAFLPLLLNAQSLIGGKSIVKVNLSSLALKNYQVTYERHLAPHLSLSLGVRYMPKTSLPVQDILSNTTDVKDQSINLGRTTVANFAITPEFRFYFFKSGMKGLYTAPYLRYSSFDFLVPVRYNDFTSPKNSSSTKPEDQYTRRDADFAGKLTAFSVGNMIGYQTQILKKVVLDFWIIGGHYGKVSGTLSTDAFVPIFTKIASTSGATQQQLDDQIKATRIAAEKALNDINVSPLKQKSTVEKSGRANVDLTGPWVGVRAVGINVGIRF